MRASTCGRWILGSSPRMTEGRKWRRLQSALPDKATLLPAPRTTLYPVILGLDPRIHPHGTPPAAFVVASGNGGPR